VTEGVALESQAAQLTLTDVSKRFGGVVAVSGVTLTVERGEIFGLIGPNGAGKTTLVNVASGQYQPETGSVELDGREISRLAPHRRAELGLSRTFQNVRLVPDPTVFENVAIGAYLTGRSGLVDALLRLPRLARDEAETRAAAEQAIELAGLAGRGDVLAASLTTGEQRLAELAKSCAMHPRLLFLDEPAAGLNPSEERRLADSIRELARHMTIVVIEHHIDLIMRLCDRVAVLNFGELIALGSPAEIRSDERVIAAYLGSVEPDAGVAAGA
jgi:branched-chain amino acid transport system ATP-binding protein